MNKPSEDLKIDSPESLLIAIHEQSEYLEDEDGIEIECISISNLTKILVKFFKNNSQIQ